MRIERRVVELATTDGMDVLNLEPEIERFLKRSEIRDGVLVVATPGSTASVTTIEFESGVVNDLKRAMERLVPAGGEYEHNLRWGDGNGYSHVRSALMGPSITLPVQDGRTLTGTWQQVVVCDFDNRPRHRKVVLQLMG